MAKIVRQRLKNDSILAELVLSKDEARELGGEMEDVTLFTSLRSQLPARISLRGRREATKYFLIPKQLRKSLNLFGSVSVQRIKRGDQDIFIYTVQKDSSRNSYVMSPTPALTTAVP